MTIGKFIKDKSKQVNRFARDEVKKQIDTTGNALKHDYEKIVWKKHGGSSTPNKNYGNDLDKFMNEPNASFPKKDKKLGNLSRRGKVAIGGAALGAAGIGSKMISNKINNFRNSINDKVASAASSDNNPINNSSSVAPWVAGGTAALGAGLALKKYLKHRKAK